MISRANLNHDYFTNRQDRYFLFKDVPNITNYFVDLLQTISSFSYKLTTDFTTQGDRKKLYKLILTQSPDPITQSNLFKVHATLLIRKFITKWMTKCESIAMRQMDQTDQTNKSNQIEQPNFDTIIFPVIQMGPLSIRQDEIATSYILDTVTEHGKIYNDETQYCEVFFTSGYFNFTEKFKEKILNTAARFTVLAASPEVISFIIIYACAHYVYIYFYAFHICPLIN